MAALKPNYTPPASARQFAEECCDLMQYLGDEGDICVPASRVGEAVLSHPEFEDVVPWGWDFPLLRDIEKQLDITSASIAPLYLRAIATFGFSQRMATSMFFDLLTKDIDPSWLSAKPLMTHSVDELQRAIVEHGKVVLKDPISGSGRGIRLVQEVLKDRELKWAEKVMEKKKYVMVEPYYDLVMNVAALYDVSRQGAPLRGFSLFDTKGFVYTRNYLLSDDLIREGIEQYIPSSVLDQVIQNHQEDLIAAAHNHYEGPVGVDMFIFRREDGSYGINPCCEFNYRYTMGFVAHEILRKHPEHHGKRFQINTPTPDNLHYSYSIA